MKTSHLIAGKELERYFDLQRALLEFHELFNEQVQVNDRAISIVGVTFLDMQLEHMLINFFVADERETRRLLSPDQPLATFSSRTTVAYLLGLIGKTVRDDLRLVGKIRNRFAHTLGASFDHEPVRSWCLSLEWHRISMLRKPPEGATPRDHFQVGVNQLIAYLSGLVGLATFERRKTRLDGVAE